MIATITPSVISGIFNAPASKSAMQRACALALLNNGNTIIHNPGSANDDLAAIDIIKGLGADVHIENESLIIKSTGEIRSTGSIDCKESGLSFRMFAAIAALADSTITLNGTGSLVKRPMHFIDEIFPLLNVKTKSNNGFLPISVTGPMQPKDISIDGSSSSQYLTGLLFAFAKAAKKTVSIKVKDLKSKPYIDLSLQMLAHFGYEVNHEDYINFYISPVEINKKNISYYTEADWSSAAFLLVAGAIAGEININGLDIHSVQADKAIIEVLKACGADFTISTGTVSINNKNILQPFVFDATDCPDLFPPLTVLAAYCKGTSIIKGISRLSAKESNRAETLVDIFAKMGIDIVLRNDEMVITGGTAIQPATVNSHHDHRIAMTCAVAGLKANGKIIIHDAEAVNKSYPAFYDHLKMLGASVSLGD